jgi:hypothetical protein
MSNIPSKVAEFVEWGLPEDRLSAFESLYIRVKSLRIHEKCRTASYTKLDMQMKPEAVGYGVVRGADA